jgi:hypothetical protein
MLQAGSINLDQVWGECPLIQVHSRMLPLESGKVADWSLDILGFPSAQSTERIPPTEQSPPTEVGVSFTPTYTRVTRSLQIPPTGVGGSFTPTYTRRNSIYANVLTVTKRGLPLSCLNDSLFMRRPDGVLSKLQAAAGKRRILQTQHTRPASLARISRSGLIRTEAPPSGRRLPRGAPVQSWQRTSRAQVAPPRRRT